MGHKLTPDEKKKVSDHVRTAEERAHPGEHVSISVGDEVQADGQVQVNIHHRTSTRTMPKDWKP